MTAPLTEPIFPRMLRTRPAPGVKLAIATGCLLFAGWRASNGQTPLLDSTFAPVISGGNTQVYAVAVQPDGKIVIGGDFDFVNGVASENLARLWQDGTLDLSFNIGDGPDGDVRALALFTNGSLAIGGNFKRYNGENREHVAKLNPSGSLDAGFDPGEGPDGDVNALVVQSGDKVVIGGEFTFFTTVPRSRVARLNSDGSLDASFDPGAGADDAVRSLALQADEKILVGGEFTNFNGVARGGIVRLLPGGGTDAGFATGSGGDEMVRAVAVQPDGKVLVGGEFSSFNGQNYRRIVRLTTNGNFDVSFTPGTGADNDVRAIALQSGGQILIGGAFTNYAGTARSHFARLKADGTLDAAFAPGADDTVRCLANDSQDRVYLGGDFRQVNGQTKHSLARFVTRTPWSGATALGGGWKYLSWFGFFNDTHYPWLYHEQHGWVFGVGTSDADVWLYTQDLGYLWTSLNVATWFFQFNRGVWLYYLVGSAGPRWFFNSGSLQWEQH